MRGKLQGRWRIFGMALLGMLLCLPAVHAAVDAQLSQNPVYIGDTFTLTISAEGGSGGEPDLAPLRKDFEIEGTGTSTRMSFVNGRMSSQVQWRVELRARRSGDLTIPPLPVGSESSLPIPLRVSDTPLAGDPKSLAAGDHVEIDVRIEAGGGNPYVQQQVPLLVRLYLDDSVRNGNYSEPRIEDAVVEQVGQERRYTTTRNGRNYRVIERRYAVFPQKSGELRIPSIRFEGEIRDRRKAQADPRGQRSLRDKLFGNDPFFQDDFFASDPFDDLFGDASQPVRKYSTELTLKVRPPAVTQGSWLPAKAVRLSDSWADAPPQLKAGQPVTRTITVEAEGLTGAQIPAMDFPAPPGTRIYREPIDNSTRLGPTGLVGISRQSVTYIPSNAGDLTLPGMQLAWWDTQRDAAATATLPAWRLKVLPGDPRSAGAPRPEESGLPDAGESAATATAASALPPNRWLESGWLLGASMLLLALLALAWWLIRRRARSTAGLVAVEPIAPAATAVSTPRPGLASSRPSETQPPVQDLSDLMQSLQTACSDRDADSAARALLALGRVHWPDQAPRSLGELADRLSAGAEEVRALDRALYGPPGEVWPADELWSIVKDGLPIVQPRHAVNSADGLPPLYPGQTE